jgi:hypothetical protein
MSCTLGREKSPGDLVLIGKRKTSCNPSISKVSLAESYQQFKFETQ